MAIDKQLSSFMPHTVTIQAFSSKNSYGEDTYSATTRTASAYVETNIVLNAGTNTNEQHQPKQIYVSDTSIAITDKITLSDGSIPEIVSIEPHTEVTGLEHTIVTFL